MKSLYEGILQGMDRTLSKSNAWKEIYPIPKIKDFYQNFDGSITVKWICPDLIQYYIKDMDDSRFKFVKKDIITGIEITIYKDKLIDTFLCNESWQRIELKGVGDWVSDKLPEVKRKCIEFFKALLNNPDNIKKLIDYDRKCEADLKTKQYCDKKTFEQLLK